MILITKLPLSSFENKNEKAYINTGLAKQMRTNRYRTPGTSMSKILTKMKPVIAGTLWKITSEK